MKIFLNEVRFLNVLSFFHHFFLIKNETSRLFQAAGHHVIFNGIGHIIHQWRQIDAIYPQVQKVENIIAYGDSPKKVIFQKIVLVQVSRLFPLYIDQF